MQQQRCATPSLIRLCKSQLYIFQRPCLHQQLRSQTNGANQQAAKAGDYCNRAATLACIAWSASCAQALQVSVVRPQAQKKTLHRLQHLQLLQQWGLEVTTVHLLAFA